MNNLDNVSTYVESHAIVPGIKLSDVYDKSDEVHTTLTSNNSMQATTNRLVQSGALPPITIENTQNPPKQDTHWYSGALNVAEDLEKGAWNEITHQPGHILASAATGAAIGLGVALLPEVVPVVAAVAVIGAIGVAAEGLNLYEHRAEISTAVKTVANEGGHSASELEHAHDYVQNMGAHTADFVAGAVGSGVGFMAKGPLVALVSKALSPAAAAEATTSLSAADSISAPTQPVASDATASIVPDLAKVAAPNPVAAAESTVLKAVKRPTLASMEDDEPPTPPFTSASTTMSVNTPEGWANLINKNGHTEMGADILGFANKWATLMEQKMAAGEPLSAAMANATSSEADLNYGLSGSMSNFAERALYDNWTYGASLETLMKAAK